MQLNDFVVAQPRPLPIFIVADTSGSMKGTKIQTLNAALREMVAALGQVEDLRGRIEVAVITFGGEVRQLHPPIPVRDCEAPELAAGGNTPMGAAFGLLKELIEDRDVVPSRAYNPTIVLVSDGLPTDIPAELRTKTEEGDARREDYLAWPALAELLASERGGRCVRLAMGIGDDADTEMLQAFVNTPSIPVIRANDSRGIAKFFQWVTLSVSSRSVSRNPNLPSLPALDGFEEDEVAF